MRKHLQVRNLIAVLAVLLLTGCSGGLLGDILGGGLGGLGGGQEQGQGQLEAEIQQVDTQRQLIQVRTREGETGAVRYDRNTFVVYRQEQYPVTALERGDIVVMQVRQDRDGSLYVGRIDVTQSVQERRGGD